MRGSWGIRGFIPLSLLDWPGKVCSILFLGGCGFRCPMCHNRDLALNEESLPEVTLIEVLEYLRNRGGWVDGVTITGGEPTLNRNLPELIREIRGVGAQVKLDTNGSNPHVVEKLLAEGLLESCHMDVKAPLTHDEYSRMAGVNVNLDSIRRSVDMLKSSGIDVVFRTTAVPGYVEEPELERILNDIGPVRRFIVQSFRRETTLDPAFGLIEEFSLQRVEKMRERFEIPNEDEERRRLFARAG